MTTLEELAGEPHRRFNPLIDEWVLVSAGRTRRPWLGAEEPPPPEDRPSYLADCYLCPGNERANGDTNPAYDTTFVFDNDFAALRPDASEAIADGWAAAGGRGAWHVSRGLLLAATRHDARCHGARGDPATSSICGRPRRSTSGGTISGSRSSRTVGAAMGASNPHPHGQIWAGTALPVEAARELATQTAYAAAHDGSRLLLDYVRQESGGPRVVVETDDVAGRRPVLGLVAVRDARGAETAGCATPRAGRRGAATTLRWCLRDLLGRYDGLFGRPFPYSMGWHQAPFGEAAEAAEAATGTGDVAAAWQLHAHFYPPLLRASVRKFMVGYELLAETQRDLTAEEAAERLRAVV